MDPFQGARHLLSKPSRWLDSPKVCVDHFFLLASATHHIWGETLESGPSPASPLYLLCFSTEIQGISWSVWLLVPASPSWVPFTRKSSGSPSTSSLFFYWIESPQNCLLCPSWLAGTAVTINTLRGLCLCDLGHFFLTSLWVHLETLRFKFSSLGHLPYMFSASSWSFLFSF